MERPAVDLWSWPARQPLLGVAAAASAGVVLGRYGHLRDVWWLAALGCALAAWWLLRLLGQRAMLLPMVLLACLMLAAAATSLRWQRFRADELGLSAPRSDQPIVMEVELLTAPRTFVSRQAWSSSPTSHCLVCALRVRDGRRWRTASGRARLQVRAELDGSWRAGDRVRVFGTYRAIDGPMNPGEFDRAAYFRGRRQLYQVQVASASALQRLRTASFWSTRRRLEELRHYCRRILDEHLSPRHAPLAAALLLGVRDQLDAETLEPFLQTGTVHLLAVSGLHLGMLVYLLFLGSRLGCLRRRHALWLSIMLVVPYALLTSAQPPVVRAAMLAAGASLARLLGRPFSNWNLLGAGALLVLVLNPLQLFQAGVQLSFLAVAALLSTRRPAWTQRSQDPLDQLIEQSRSFWSRWLRYAARQVLADLWSGLMVWLVTLPLVVYCFHRASPLAVVANPLLWLPIAGALCTGFLLLFTGGLLGPLTQALAWICDLCLRGTMTGIRWADSVPGSHYWLPSPPWFLVLAIYAALVLVVLCRGRWRIAAHALCWLAAVGALAGCWVRSVRDVRDPALEATFFSVGHGTCVLLELPYGKNIIYDAGRLGAPQRLVDALSRTLWDRGIRRLDLLLVSHTDADHFNAVSGVLSRFPIDAFGLASPLSNSRSELVRQLAAELTQREIPLVPIQAGEVFRLPGGVELECLHPPAGFAGRSDNEASLVLLVRYAGRTLLLPGDLEGEGLRGLLERAPPASSFDLVMAPHHGSAASNHRPWTAWARARHVVISAAAPVADQTRQAYQTQGTRIWETASCGAVRVRITPHGEWEMSGFRGAPSP